MKIALILLIPAAIAFGQATPTPAALPAAFACGQMAFSPTFMGTNIKTLVEHIEAQSQPKSEFETTEQYQQRIQQQRPAEKHVFLFGGSFDYDADTAVMKAKTSRVSLRGIALRSDTGFGEDRLATNGFGAMTMVSVSSTISYGLNWGDLSGTAPELTEFLRTGDITIAMASEQARAVKPFLRLAIVAKIRPHVSRLTSQYHKATWDAPSESVSGGYSLDAMPERIVVFDSMTGNILKTVPSCN